MAVTSSRNTVTRRWLRLPDGWDTTWKAARSASGSGTTPAYVAVLGDSNAQGFATTNHATKSFPVLLRNALAAKYGSYADFYSVAGSQRFVTAQGGGGTVTGTPWWTFDTTFGGTGSQMNSYGLGTTVFQDLGGTYPVTWVNAGSATFTTPYACTAFDVIYHDYNTTGTWKYNIDNSAGGGLVTVTNDARNSMRRLAITGQTNATHVLRFGAPSVALAMGLNGVVTYNPSAAGKGIGFANTGATGFRVFDWLQSPLQSPADRAQQWQGRYKTAVGVESTTGFGFPTQPHLAIIELGINDAQANVGLVQFRLALRKLCDSLRRGRDGCSILFLICPNPTTTDSDVTFQFTRAESWSLYADQIYGIAEEYQCAVLNLHADWMSTPATQGLIGASDPHPTDLGHQTIADALASVIV